MKLSPPSPACWNRQTSLVLWSLLLLASSGVLAQDWAGRGRLNGIVTDEAGQPIAEASVQLRAPGNPAAGPPDLKTDKKGKWSYLGLVGGNWTVKITAQGFVPSEGVAYVNEFQPNPLVAIKLRRLESVAPAADPKLLEAQKAVERGDALLKARKPAEARAEFERSLGPLDPENQRIVRKRIATTYMLEGMDERAVEILKSVLEEDPQDADALRLIVDRLTVLGRDAEAAAYLQRMPEGTALDPSTVLNQGINLYNAGKLDDALVKFEAVVAARPQWADAYYYRGMALLGLRQLERAKGDLQKVLELDPQGPNADTCRELLKSL